jgi:hypothetical protein
VVWSVRVCDISEQNLVASRSMLSIVKCAVYMGAKRTMGIIIVSNKFSISSWGYF